MKIPERYEVLDIAELARRLGYTNSTIRTHLARHRFDKIPEPSRRLAMGPVWYLGDVEEWRAIRKGQKV
jgi:predicted DNA-binding transcriptional regulator AlpA